MPAVKLTKRVLDGLQKAPPSVRTPYWDAELRRFGAVAYPTGAITSIVQYRNASGVTRKYKVGLFGSTTLEQARKQASTLLGRVDKGEDPQEDKVGRRTGVTIADFCDTFSLLC